MAKDDFKNYRKGFIISLLQLGQWWIILNGQEVLPNDLVWCGQTLQIHTELFIENNLPTFLHMSHLLILFHPQKMTKWTMILKVPDSWNWISLQKWLKFLNIPLIRCWGGLISLSDSKSIYKSVIVVVVVFNVETVDSKLEIQNS